MERCRTNSSKFRGAGCRRSKRARRTETLWGSLILQPADAPCLSGQRNDDDYHVLENGVVVGRILLSAAPRNRLWT
jgi:hypothetical protein